MEAGDYFVVVDVRGEHVCVSRHSKEERDAIAEQVRKSGRFSGFKASVVRIGRIKPRVKAGQS